MTSSVYYLDYTDGSAYESISESLTISNVPEVRMVQSVYAEINDRIFKLKEFIFRKSIGFIIALIGSLIFMVILIWSQYQIYQYDIAIKYLTGCSGYERNKALIHQTICLNLLSALIIFVFNNWTYLPMAFILLTFSDLLIISILGEYYCKNNLNKILKGDYIWSN